MVHKTKAKRKKKL